MKKILLFAAAALFATATMAQHHSMSQKVWTPRHNLHSSLDLVLKDKALKPDMKVISQLQAPKVQVKAARRADSDNAIAGIAQSGLIYTDMMGVVNHNMVSGFKYYATADKVYLAFPNMQYMEGTYVTDQTNRYAADGADSVRFELGTLAGTDGEGNKYVYAGTTLSLSQTGSSSQRNTEQYLGAYYFKDYNELYIPANKLTDFVSVYPEDATKTDAALYSWGDLDIFSQDEMQEYIYKATWTANELEMDNEGNVTRTPVSGDAKVFVTRYGYYVQGIYPDFPAIADAWVFLGTSADGTQATISENQFLGSGYYYTDNTRTTTAYVEFGPVSIVSDFSAWADNYAKVFFIADDDATQTTTLMDDGTTTVSVYGFSKTSSMAGGWAHWGDMNITITYEPAYTGITAVKGGAKEDGAWYTIAGQRVAQPATKGLYIHNGKKFVVK